MHTATISEGPKQSKWTNAEAKLAVNLAFASRMLSRDGHDDLICRGAETSGRLIGLRLRLLRLRRLFRGLGNRRETQQQDEGRYC